jgi:hypothetical protein
MSSALATVRAAFKADLEAITVVNGYNNTVKAVNDDFRIATVFPTLTFAYTPTGKDVPEDEAWECFKETTPFVITAQIQSTTSTGTDSNLIAQFDSLVQDIKRVVTANHKKYIMSSPPWFVEGEILTHPIYPDGSNKGEFSVMGTIRVRNTDSTFT